MRVAGRGVPWQTVANRATVAGFPGLFRGAVASDPGYPAPLSSASAWYDARDITTAGQQTLTSRVGSGVATFGSTAGSDFNDPVRLPHDGTNYVYLPGTASNNLSVPKDGGWAGTLHVTATLIDDTTATFTTTASPILIGNTLLGAGRYKRFDVRDTDGAGTLRITIDLTTETLGQTSWTATTGQTVTVNRATSGLTTAVVTRPLFLGDGTDDFVLLPTSDTPTITPTTGALTVLVVSRSWPTGGTTRGLLSWGQGAYQGLTLYESAGATLSVAARDGASGQAIDAQAIVTGGNGNLAAKGFLVNNGQLVVADSVNGIGVSPVSLSALTSFSFSSQGRLDSAAGQAISSPRGGEYFAMVTWPRALTAQELADASTFLLGTYT